MAHFLSDVVAVTPIENSSVILFFLPSGDSSATGSLRLLPAQLDRPCCLSPGIGSRPPAQPPLTFALALFRLIDRNQLALHLVPKM
jgi:hypothetical protein